MRLGMVMPALLILLADILPGAMNPDSSETAITQYRVGLGYGVSQYEDKSFSCEGDLIESFPADLRGGGGLLELRHRKFRASGFLGSIAYDRGLPDYEGIYGGLVLAGEWRTFGIGGGIGGVSGTEATALPSVYLRSGSLDSWHLRIEFLPPTENLTSTGWFRLGLANNRGFKPGWGGAMGFSLGPYSYPEEEFHPRFFGDLDIPMSSGGPLYLTLRMQVGPGTERTHWSASAGLRFDINEHH
jgi:hypothetical protein